MTEPERQSIWKKEISFRRTPKEKQVATTAAAPPKPAEQSIWKKEISFRRSPKPPVPAPPAAAAKSDEPSIWKKEISFRRKPKQEKGLAVPPAAPQPARPESVERLRPLAQEPLDPVSLPPVTPPVAPPPAAPPVSEPVAPPVTPPVAPPVPAPPPQPVAPPPPPVAAPVPPPAAPPVPPPVVAPFTPPVAPPVEPPAPPPPVAAPPPPVAAPAPPVAVPPPPPPAAAVPPLTPEASSPAVPEAEPDPEPTLVLPPELPFEPAPMPGPEVASAPVPTPAPPEPVAATPAPVAEPEWATPPEPESHPAEQAPPQSRRQRKDAKKAADRLAREQKQRAKYLAKEERKTAPSGRPRVVGLKIGASQIAAAQVVNKGGPRVVRMARMPLERGIIVGGELRESEELAAALKTFFRKNKLPRNCVRLGISNNRIGVRTFEITGIEDSKQLGNAIRFRAQETLPIPLDEAVLDYRILDDRVGEDGQHVRRVLLVVAHRELVNRYVAACRKAGLKLIGIDLEAFALLRALGDPSRPQAAAEDAGLVCVSIGHDRSTLAVSDGRICDFTRVLAWGGSTLDIALARVLDLTPSETEPIKRELSLFEEGEAAGLDARRAALAREAIAAEIQAFARELVASLRFYQEQPGSLGIAEILITGGGAEFGGLAYELERLIGVTVRVADPLERVKMPRKLRKLSVGFAGSLAVAVGLGIED